MRWHKIYGLSLRHIFLIKSSFPRLLDLIYWPTIQVFWGFISKFFTLTSSYYSNTIGVILTAAILYDFLFRSSISYNMMFLEEIWSRNFTNLFIAPIKISEIITALYLNSHYKNFNWLYSCYFNRNSYVWCFSFCFRFAPTISFNCSISFWCNFRFNSYIWINKIWSIF